MKEAKLYLSSRVSQDNPSSYYLSLFEGGRFISFINDYFPIQFGEILSCVIELCAGHNKGACNGSVIIKYVVNILLAKHLAYSGFEVESHLMDQSIPAMLISPTLVGHFSTLSVPEVRHKSTPTALPRALSFNDKFVGKDDKLVINSV